MRFEMRMRLAREKNESFAGCVVEESVTVNGVLLKSRRRAVTMKKKNIHCFELKTLSLFFPLDKAHLSYVVLSFIRFYLSFIFLQKKPNFFFLKRKKIIGII